VSGRPADYGLPVSEVQKKLRGFQSALWKEHDAQLSGSVCHYTSNGGLEGMLRSGAFWLSDMSTVNDPSELVYFYSVLRPILLRKSVPRAVNEGLINATDIFAFGTSWFGYIFSFCRAINKLPQWTTYADAAKGVAISFDVERLAVAGQPDKYALISVIYDPVIQAKQTEQTVDHAIQLGRELGVTKRQQVRFWFEVTLHLLHCAIRFKHPAYRDEEEVRILLLRPGREGAKTRLNRRGEQMHYIEVPLPKEAITGVMLGPCSPVSVGDTEHLVADAGVSIPITKSDIPYR
jgi:hypothetical protein